MHRLAIYHLETLIWIARLGTFRAAADRLNTTQPGISARVREIEGQLGVELFRREGRGVTLTVRGRQLVQDCEPLLAGFERALLEAGNYRGATGVVRIVSGEIAAASCLPEFTKGLMVDLPGVTLQIDLDLTGRMIQQVIAGTRDVAFLAGPIVSPGLRTAPIGEVSLAWLASPGIGANTKLRSGIPIWSVGEHSPMHQMTREGLNRTEFPARAINTCSIVACGGGAAVFPITMAQRYLADGRLVELQPHLRFSIEFEAAVRSNETDPIILEFFRRASSLKILSD
jgi:DNA-binding transcriptional LysR family regulator